MRTKSKWPMIIGVAIACIALVGISTSVYLVKTEGFEGIWRRKRQFIESNNPELKPILDEAERRVR